MYTFIAKNEKQLGVCLKLLYAENTKGSYEIIKTSNGKFVFEITVRLDEDVYLKLKEYYENVIT